MNELRTFFKMLQLTKHRKYMYWLSLLIQMIINIAIELLYAVVGKNFIVSINKSDINLLKITTIAAFSVVILKSTSFMFNYVGSLAVRDIMLKIRMNLFKHMCKLDVEYYEKNHSGDTISRLANDVEPIKNFLSTNVSDLVFNIVLLIGNIVMILYFDSYIGLIVIMFTFISSIVSIYLTRKIKNINTNIFKNMSNISQKVGDILAGFRVLKVYPARTIMARFDADNDESIKYKRELAYENGLVYGFGYIIYILINVGVIILGVYFTLMGKASLENVVAIISLQETVAYIIMTFGEDISDVRAKIASTKRVFDIMEVQPEVESYNIESEDEPYKNSVVSFRNVGFSYKTKEDILKNININVKKGETIALVGQSGGGKSTVIKLLLGFYCINSGGLFINGKAISEYDLKALRELSAYVPQDASLFEGSIFDNIKFAKPNATDEEVYNAAKFANAHDFILELPDKYNTNVGARGENLSGGQRQRVSIARAMIKNANLLLLDEATSALDNESESIVQKGIENLMKGKTTIVVAHRLSTIKNADWIYVFENGDIVEEGTHEALIDKAGAYNKLYKYFEKS